MKIPTNVADMWKSAQSGESLGSLAIESVPSSVPGKKRSKVSIQLRSDTGAVSDSGGSASTSELSKITEYTLDEIQAMKSTNSNMVVFDSNEDQDFALKGHVSTFWSLTPKDNEQYRQAVKSRQLAASTKVHSVKSIDSKAVFEHSNKVQDVGFKPPAYVTGNRLDSDNQAAYASRRGRGEKATEKEIQEIKKKLLEVFGKREHLTFKEINGYCKAYEPDLRELVKKYCDYHIKGSLKTHYELKPEYKGSVSSTSK